MAAVLARRLSCVVVRLSDSICNEQSQHDSRQLKRVVKMFKHGGIILHLGRWHSSGSVSRPEWSIGPLETSKLEKSV